MDSFEVVDRTLLEERRTGRGRGEERQTVQEHRRAGRRSLVEEVGRKPGREEERRIEVGIHLDRTGPEEGEERRIRLFGDRR